jgi:hypothetical protein
MHTPEDTHYDGDCWAWIEQVARVFVIGVGSLLALALLLAAAFVAWYGA